MTGAIGELVTAASPKGRQDQDQKAGSREAGRERVQAMYVFGEISPVLVSEGGLEPPCPFGALAPQASASAYSATRTKSWLRPPQLTVPAASR